MCVMSMGEDDDKESNGSNTKPLISKDSEEVENQVDDGEESECDSLLPPRRKGGISRKSGKVGRKVQWNDNNGHKLVEILEFEPSDADSDDEDSDACMCTIM